MKAFIEAYRNIQQQVHQNAVDHGWWDDHMDVKEYIDTVRKNFNQKTLPKPMLKVFELAEKAMDRNDGEFIALVHSELSEALEGMRHGNPASDKIPEFSAVEEELADVVIRIMDMSERRGWRIAEALAAKHEMNKGRLHRHGGKAF